MHNVSPLKSINFGATGTEAKLQNVAFILSTYKNTCPMDRGFGWEPPIDLPLELAKSQMAAQIIEAIESNEEGIRVEEVTFTDDAPNGILIPQVKVVIEDGEI